ncbi:hypothetical protein I4F81_012504 [Pyropia yezoensis]|uniref:Uncharacterized protein n=1 Tax=Pyropia yezoensis TaxID=2788 RepID=A0ACC3CJB3_PYRYE|nr:hypothetical protein I4F81_012504 [Neopyropia yezoensis]
MSPANRPFAAIVFDLDGTLVDSIQDIADGANMALAALGRPPRSVSDYHKLAGGGNRLLMGGALETTDEALLDKAVALKVAADAASDHAASIPFPGISALLAALAAGGGGGDEDCGDARHPPPPALAILSNKSEPFVVSLTARLFPSTPFRVVAGATDTRPLKPDAGALAAVCAELGVVPRDAVLSHGPLVLPPPLLLSHEPALPSHHPSLPPLLFIHLCPSLLLVMASWDAASELGAEGVPDWTRTVGALVNGPVRDGLGFGRSTVLGDVVGRVVADWTASRGVFRRMLFLRLSTDAPLRGGVPSESSLGAADSSLVDLLRVLTTGDGRPALALRLGCVSMTGSSEGAVSVIPKLTSWVPLDVVADNLPPLLLEASDAVDAGNGKIANALQGTRLVVLVLWPQVQTMELASRIGLSACLAVVRSRYETLRHFGSASQDVDEGTPAIRWTRAEQVMWLVMLFDAARRRPLVVDKRRRQLYGSQLVSLLLFTVEMGTPLQVREALQLVRRWVGVGRPKQNPLEMGGAECAEDGSFWTTKLVDVLLLALSRQGWDALSGEVLGLVSAAEFADVPSCVALVDGLQVCAAGLSTEDVRDGWIAAHTAVSHVLAGVVARCPSDWEHPPSVVLAVEAATRFAFGVPAVHFLLDSFVSLAKQQSISCITRILASAAGGGDAASDPSVDVAAPVAARTFCGGSPPEALLLLCRHAIRCGVSGQDGGVGGEATASLGASLLRIGHQPTMELFLVKVVSHCSDSTLLDLLGDPGFFAAGALTGAMRTVLSRTVHRRLQRTDLTKPVLTWSMHPPEKWGRRRTALAVALAEFFEDGEETRLEMTGFSSSVQAQTMLQRATAGQTYDAGAGWSASFEVSSRSAATQLTVLKTRCVHEGRLAAWRIRKKVADILTSLLASPPTPVAVDEAGGGPAETPVGTPAGAPVDQLASPVPTASDGDDSGDASATVSGRSVRTGESGGFASSSRWTPTPSEGTVFGTPSPKRQRT